MTIKAESLLSWLKANAVSSTNQTDQIWFRCCTNGLIDLVCFSMAVDKRGRATSLHCTLIDKELHGDRSQPGSMSSS